MDTTNRLLALDVFRGMTIAGMILVNNPGSWSTVYKPLLHADWHGSTPTDWVFPFFLFMVGMAIPIALGRRKAAGEGLGGLRRKIIIRHCRKSTGDGSSQWRGINQATSDLI